MAEEKFDSEFETIQKTSVELSDIYEKIVSFDISKNTNEEKKTEIINVLNGYYWTINKSTGGGISGDEKIQVTGQIPFVYVTEMRQMFSSQITNVINSIMSIGSSAQKVKSISKNIQQIADSIRQTTNEKSDSDTTNTISQQQTDNPEKGTESTNSPSQQNQENISSQGANGNTITINTNSNVEQTTENQPNAWDKTRGSVLYGAGKVSETVASIGNGSLDVLSGLLSALGMDLSQIYEHSNIKDSKLLFPYLYLYATKNTGKFYVFPLLSKDSAAFHVANSFSESASDNNNISTLMTGGLVNMMTELPKSISGVMNDMSQLTNLFLNKGSDKGFENNWMEMGKFYNYPTDGDEITISFPLYNTVEKDGWMKNHRFCFSFALRNMPFKLDNASYKMPLLYDVMIPGVKRLPFAYVADLTITPRGIIRPLKGENYIKHFLNNQSSNENMVYNIPEAWVVSIRFKDLIGQSANKILAQMVEGNIEASENK